MKNKSNNLLSEFFGSCQNGLRAAKSAPHRKVLHEFGLDENKIKVGFNSGQFHHGKSEKFKKKYLELGILTKSDASVNKTDRVAYTCFGREALIFPLENELGEIVNLYAYRLKIKSQREQYLNNHGLYPEYPSMNVKRLYLTTTILEASVLIEAGLLTLHTKVLALDEGELLQKHIEAIRGINDLVELVFLCPNAEEFYEVLSKQGVKARMIIASIEGMTINEFYLNHSAEDLFEYLEDKCNSKETRANQLDVKNERHIEYQGILGRYTVLGGIPSDTSSMKVDMRLKPHGSLKKHRINFDLFNYSTFENECERMGFKEGIHSSELSEDLNVIADLLDDYRMDLHFNDRIDESELQARKENTPQAQKEAVKFLSEPRLFERLDKLIGATGFIGEEKSRLTTFVIASSYKADYSLHGIVKGFSGGGKSHMINGIAGLMPSEDVLDYTSLSNKAFNHFRSDELVDKLVIVQDFDGIGKDGRLALRELQSNKSITSSAPQKDMHGDLITVTKKVYGGFASLMATTNSDIYYDNEDRSILLGIDESEAQTERVMKRQNLFYAGKIDTDIEEENRLLIRNCVRVLKPYEVINPFADKIVLPIEIKGLRRLNKQFNDFICQVTILNQYQRETDAHDRLITTIEDIEIALDIFFEPLMFKVDDLDSSTRQFYERLKVFVRSKPKADNATFVMRELREEFNLSNSYLDKWIKKLQHLGYVAISDGTKNRGFEYSIGYWDNLEKAKTNIKEQLKDQLSQLK